MYTPKDGITFPPAACTAAMPAPDRPAAGREAALAVTIHYSGFTVLQGCHTLGMAQ
jgi:hypothetical protein